MTKIKNIFYCRLQEEIILSNPIYLETMEQSQLILFSMEERKILQVIIILATTIIVLII
jgi:hypothetical protein